MTNQKFIAVALTFLCFGLASGQDKETNCAACHQLDGMGNAIGAKLMGIGKIGREAILQNILDPNRDVKAEYLNYTLVTNSGETHSGMIQSESTNSVTLRRLDGSVAEILRVDIAGISGMGISFMPTGLENQIDTIAMADLLAYLTALDRIRLSRSSLAEATSSPFYPPFEGTSVESFQRGRLPFHFTKKPKNNRISLPPLLPPSPERPFGISNKS